MFFDFAAIGPAERYKLMASTIVPRPIALVVTLDGEGRVNAAPFSFFNMMSFDPPLVAFGISYSAAGNAKDTGNNIRSHGEFVVNLVSDAMARSTNVTAIEFGPQVDELAAAGFEAVACQLVSPPRIMESPVAFECVRHLAIAVSDHAEIVIGKIVAVHIRDDAVLDRERCYVDTPALDLVARMHGKGWYARSREQFEIPRISVAEWETDKATGEPSAGPG